MNYIKKIELFEEKYNFEWGENLYQKIIFRLAKLELPISIAAPFWLNFVSFGILFQFLTMCLFFITFFLYNSTFLNTLVTISFWSMIIFGLVLSLKIELDKKYYFLIKFLWFKDYNNSFIPKYQLFLKSEKEKVIFFLLYLPPILSIIYYVKNSIFFFTCLLAFFLTYHSLKSIQSYKQVKKWKANKADNIKFNINYYDSFLVTFDTRNAKKLYFPKIEFSYTIKGIQYISNNIYIDQYNRRGLFFIFCKEPIIKWINKHQSNTHIYYNPKNKNQALFSNNVSPLSIIHDILIAFISWLLPLVLYANKIWLAS